MHSITTISPYLREFGWYSLDKYINMDLEKAEDVKTLESLRTEKVKYLYPAPCLSVDQPSMESCYFSQLFLLIEQ